MRQILHWYCIANLEKYLGKQVGRRGRWSRPSLHHLSKFVSWRAGLSRRVSWLGLLWYSGSLVQLRDSLLPFTGTQPLPSQPLSSNTTVQKVIWSNMLTRQDMRKYRNTTKYIQTKTSTTDCWHVWGSKDVNWYPIWCHICRYPEVFLCGPPKVSLLKPNTWSGRQATCSRNKWGAIKASSRIWSTSKDAYLELPTTVQALCTLWQCLILWSKKIFATKGLNENGHPSLRVLIIGSCVKSTCPVHKRILGQDIHMGGGWDLWCCI